MKVMESINLKIDILAMIIYTIMFTLIFIFFYNRYNYPKIAAEVWCRRINEYEKANKKKVLIEDVPLIFKKK